MRYSHYILFLVIFSFITNLLFSLTIEEFKVQNNIDDTKPLFLDNPFTIKADDGSTFVIKRLNPYYDENIRIPLRTSGMFVGLNEIMVIVEGEAYYFLLCEDETHILLRIDDEINYFQKHGNSLKLEKYGDFKNVSAYKFSYLIFDGYYSHLDNRIIKEKIIWMDTEKDQYCGSREYQPIEFKDNSHKTDEGKLYFDYVEDLYIYIVEEEIARCSKLLDEDIDYTINIDVYFAVHGIDIYNAELGKVLMEQLDFLWKNERKYEKLRHYNQSRMNTYGQSVSKSNMSFQFFWQTDDYVETKPDIEGELPTTEEELIEYNRWLLSRFRDLNRGNFPYFRDLYGTELRYAIVNKGLKVISAGKDKVFDTEDDELFIRTYESVGMKPLNEK